MKTLRDILPRASQSCIDANPQLSVATDNKSSVAGRSRTRVGLRCGMNKTESEFALILEAMKRKGEILRYEFEGITLRFANVKYTPDFMVFRAPWRDKPDLHGTVREDQSTILFVETKGPFIRGNRERAVERFRHAKTYWPEFTFELHQRTKDGWKQLI